MLSDSGKRPGKTCKKKGQAVQIPAWRDFPLIAQQKKKKVGAGLISLNKKKERKRKKGAKRTKKKKVAHAVDVEPTDQGQKKMPIKRRRQK